MKRNLICIIVILIVTAMVFSSCGVYNGALLNQMMWKLESAVSAKTQILDRASVHGKLNGNGNGVQFFGAVLVEGIAEEEIRQIIEQLSDEYEEVNYAQQSGNEIQLRHLEHRKPRFSYSSFAENKQYYMIYFIESEHPYANPMDLSGH